MVDTTGSHLAAAPKRLDTPAAAAYTGLAIGTLNKLRLRGTGPEYLKIGRRVIYERDTLDAWLSKYRCRSTAQNA